MGLSCFSRNETDHLILVNRIEPMRAGLADRRAHGARLDRTRRSAMKWLMEFYNERRGILVRYGIEAPLPAEAALLAWKAVLAEHPSTPRRSRLSLFERAQRVEGQDASGWVLYRIVTDSEHGSPRVAQAHAA
jgi:hypothetical protein